MAKNRRAETAAERFGGPIKAFVICFLIGSAGIGYVWQRGELDQLGRQIKAREIRLSELQRQNKIRADQLAALMSPVALEARVKRLNLGLVQVPLSQIVRLVETPVDAMPNPAGTETGSLLTHVAR